MTDQARKFGVEIMEDTITEVDFDGETKILRSAREEYGAKAVIVAAGADPVKIGCPGEKELAGKGVSYCATCDAAFFEDMSVFVVGGGDAAVEEAIYLTKFARDVTIIHRRDELRAAKSIQEKAFSNDKIHFMWNSVVTAITGDGIAESMTIKDTVTGEERQVDANEEDGVLGIFVFIGFKPHSELFEGKLNMEKGYIITDDDMKTNVKGVFAAGDIRKKSLRQVVTAAADGAIAAVQAGKYIEEMLK